jgi:hypothetical protein
VARLRSPLHPPVRFGKGPTEKGLLHGNLAGGLLHLTGGDWKRTTTSGTAPVPDPPTCLVPRQPFRWTKDADQILTQGPGVLSL